MDKLIVKKMNMKNFKCFQEKSILFSENTTIQGDNETGKTSIADAFYWCLFGKNSLGEKGFECKNTLSKDGENVEVELITQFGSREIDFKRVHEAKFTRLKEFNGYSTQCFINGIPKSVKDFEKEVYHILGVEMDEFNLIANPRFLTEQIKGGKGVLDWQKRRELLYTLTEFEPDKELVQKNSQFALLELALNKYNTISEYLQAIKFDISKVNSEIESLPTRIDQQMKNIIPLDFSPAELQNEKQELQNTISELENNEQYAELKKNTKALLSQINKKKEEIETLNNATFKFMQLQKEKFLKEQSEKKLELQQQYFDSEKEINEIKNKMQEEINQLRLMQQQKKQNIQKIEMSIEKIQKNQSALEGKTLCPVCFQPLDKKETMDENIKNQIAQLQQQKQKIETDFNQLLQKIKEIQQEQQNIDTSNLESIKTQIAQLQQQKPKIEKPSEEKINQLQEELSKIQSDFDDTQQKMEQKTKEVQQQIKNCFARISEIDRKLSIVEQNKNSEALYNDLQQELQTYLSKKDELQKMYDLCSDFVQYKCKQITETINNCFSIVRWNLFKFNKTDGELKEYCEPEVNGREYKDLSMSTKIIAGLDIIQAFQKHFNISLPIFIDNAESITFFPNMDTQLIKLYVQEENCPKCGNKTKRRNSNLLFQCKNCGHEFNKKLKVK